MSETMVLPATSDNPAERSDSIIDDDAEFVKLFVGQIPKEMSEELLLPFFSEFGPVAELTVIRDKINQTHKGCAFLTYYLQQSARRAVDQLHDKIKLPNAINPLQVRIAESQAERENKLFIGMLPKTTDEEDLHNMFAPYGELREVHIIRGPEGSSKGCAFVKFVDRDAAMVAIEDMNELIPQGSTRPLVVKFADSKKQMKLRDEDGGGSPPERINQNDNMQSSRIPDFWSKQYQQQQQQQQQQRQQMMYSYPIANGAMQQPQQQQQQILNVPLTMPYASPGNPQQQQQQQQQFIYMQQQNTTISGYAFDPNTSRLSGDGDGRYPSSQPYNRQQQQQQYQSNAPSRQRNGWPSTGGRGDKNRHNGSSHSFSNHDQDDMYSPLDSNGEISSRSNANVQRPTEGPAGANLFIYHLPRDLTDADLPTLFAPFGNVISAKVFVDKKTSDSKGFGFVSYDTVASADAAINAMNGFQIGSKRLKVQHKRLTGYDEDPSSQYGSDRHNGGGGNMGMGSRGGGDRMYGSGQSRPQPMNSNTDMNLNMGMQSQNGGQDQRDGFQAGDNTRFQMTSYGPMQTNQQQPYIPGQMSVSSMAQGQGLDGNYSQASSVSQQQQQHRQPQQQTVPSQFQDDAVEREDDAQYGT